MATMAGRGRLAITLLNSLDVRAAGTATDAYAELPRAGADASGSGSLLQEIVFSLLDLFSGRYCCRELRGMQGTGAERRGGGRCIPA